MLEIAKQQFLIEHLSQSAADFERCVASIDPIHWDFRRAPGEWSIGEIAEHVLIVDNNVANMSSILQQLPDEPYSEEHCARKEKMILAMAVDRNTRIEAPPSVRPKGSLANALGFYPAFRDAHERMLAAATETPHLLRGRFTMHPFLKKLDGYQWLLVCSCHRRRHLGQLEEVRNTIPGKNT
jgi:hypothetical protein